MERVFAFAEHPVDAACCVAVAIGEPDEDQRHIGILHRTRDSEPELLHLARHCRLQNDAELPDYLTVWVAPTVPLERQRSIAAFCRRVWRKNARGGITYAFSNPGESFDAATGAFLIGPSRFGLTCASFVLAVFDAAGLPLADYASWPSDRPGDPQWQERIVKSLQSRAAPEHIVHLRNEIGAVRYRPEEVAASTVLAPPPVVFQRAEELGVQILNRIRQISASSNESE